jgi:hypothetical protein
MDRRRRAAWREALLLAVIFGASLWLRVAHLDAFLIVDEPKWAKRATSFYNALSSGQLEATYQVGHPGVINMWLGTVGSAMESLQQYGGLCPEVTIRPEQNPDACAIGETALITRMRILVALFTWLACLLAYLLLHKLYSPEVALLAAPLLALDPFFLAHSRVAHLDAVLASGMLISTLSLLLFLHSSRQRWLILSGLAAGLSMAEKSPGWFTFLVAGALLLTTALRSGTPVRQALYRAASSGALWSAVALGAFALLWPALWVAPLPTLSKVFNEGLAHSEAAYEDVHFFFGRVQGDPGPAFYLTALLFRLSPLALVGLFGAIWALVRWPARKSLIPWLTLVLAYLVLMSVSPKKGDRYLLPVFPAIDVLSGLALAAGLARMACRRRRWCVWARRIVPAAMLTVQLGILVPLTPYYLAYYNWIAGGPRVAARTLDVGLGEGLDRAAAYLNGKPDVSSLHVATWYREAFAPQFQGRSTSLSFATLVDSDYVVFYINQLQRQLGWSKFQACCEHRKPEYVARINGIDYAQVYAQPKPHLALDSISRDATEDDLVAVDMPSLFSRYYEGGAPLWIVGQSEDETAMLRELTERLAGKTRVWYVVYPQARSPLASPVEAALQDQSCGSEQMDWAPVRVTLFRLCAAVE